MRRLNLAQAFNPIGSITGVLIGTVFIFSGVELRPGQIAALRARHTYAAYLHSETMGVVAPYMVLGALTLTMLVLIAATRFPNALTHSSSSSTMAKSPSEKCTPSAVLLSAAEDHNSLAMLVRREAETLGQLLTRLDQAIAKALE